MSLVLQSPFLGPLGGDIGDRQSKAKLPRNVATVG
jgi:hypothetical protein